MPKPCMFFQVDIKKFVKIGRPGYRVTKQRDPETGQQSLLFEIDYPEIAEGIMPRHRFMSAYEQKIEPPDKKWQYLLFAAEPYETIAFKVPSREVDKSEARFWTLWNKDTKEFFLQFAFRPLVGGAGEPTRTSMGARPNNFSQGQVVRSLPPNLLPMPPPPPPPPASNSSAAATSAMGTANNNQPQQQQGAPPSSVGMVPPPPPPQLNPVPPPPVPKFV